MSGSRMKLRAVLLSFVMVTSIMAAGVAFTGTAAADASNTDTSGPSIQTVQLDNAGGNDKIYVTFDEPVFANADRTGGLEASDFSYTDVVGTDDGADSVQSVSHSAGDQVALLTMDSTTSANDASDPDTIAANSNSIFDGSGNAAGTSSSNVNNGVPSIVAVEGEPTTKTVTVTFSEGVSQSDESNLQTGDFSLASGITFGSLSHSSGSATKAGAIVTITTSSDVSPGDIGSATVAPNSGTAIEDDLAGSGDNVGTGTVNVQDNTEPFIQSVSTADTNANGDVDQLTVTMSEPIDDGESDGAGFSLPGSNQQVDSVSDLGGSDNNQVVLSVSGSGLDGTDVTPDVDLAADTIADLQSSSFAAGNSHSFTSTTDNADPVILTFTATAGSQTATVTFSEDVEAQGSGDLSPSDFSYVDTSSSDASGISGVATSGFATTVDLTLNRQITSSDIGADTIDDNDGAQDRAGNDVTDGDSPVTLTEAGADLPGSTNNDMKFQIDSDTTAEVVAGSANESVGAITLKDDASNNQIAFASDIVITLPQGITVNQSASALNTANIITSDSGGVAIDSVSVDNSDNQGEITLSTSGQSNPGEEILFKTGILVLNVDGNAVDTSSQTGPSSTSTNLDITVDNFQGEAALSNAIDVRSSTATAPNGDTGNNGPDLAAGSENLAGGSGYDADDEIVRIAAGDILSTIEGTDEPLIGNNTEIVYTLESGTGVRFDTDNTGSNLLANTDIDDGDNADELDQGDITVTSKEIRVPVVDSIDDSDATAAANIDLQNLVFETSGDATSADLNVTLEAPPVSSSPYVDDSGSGSLGTIDNYATVLNPDINIDNTANKQLAVGLNQQFLPEGTNLQNADAAIEITDTSGGQLAAGENVTIRLNSSAVTFDTSQQTSVADGAITASSDDTLEAGINDGGGSGVDVADPGITINQNSIEIALVDEGSSTTSAGDDLHLGDVAVNVSSTASDETSVELEAITRPSAGSPDVSTTSTAGKNDGPSPESDQFITLQRPEFELASGNQNANPSSSSNITFDVDGDGFTQQRVDSNNDFALVLRNIIDGQIADTTNVSVSLEQGTGVTFDTSADTSTGTLNNNDADIDVNSEDISINNVDIRDSTTLNLEVSDVNTNGAADTQFSGTTNDIVIDDLPLNVTGSASITRISVTTNATVSEPDQGDATTGGGTFTSTVDNEVTTTLDAVLEPNQINPSDVKVDPDRGDGTGFNNFAFSADQQVDSPQVTSTITSGVKVRDGGSSFGGADVNLEIVQTPNGSSGSSLNTTVVTTNQNGEAFFNFTAGDTIGDYVVNASIDGVSGGVNVTYTAQPGDIAGLSATPIENAIAGDGSEVGTASLFINATDANGNPVAQSATVSLTADGVGAGDVTAFDDKASDGTGTSQSDNLQDGQFSLDSDGSSVIDVDSSQVENVTITVETSGESDDGTVTFFDQVGGIDLSLNETSVAVDDTVSADATITEEDGTTIEVPDVNVDFDDNNNGNTTFDADADAVSATTNDAGVASVNVTAEQLGSSTIDVQSNLRSDSATITVEEQEQLPDRSITFDDKTVGNTSTDIAVESATFNGSQSFNVVVHEATRNDDGTVNIGQKIGESVELDNGTQTDITVNISKQVDPDDDVSQLTEDQVLVAMLHTTNTSDDDDIVHTAPITEDGTENTPPVFDDANITVSPLEGTTGDFDSDGDGELSVNDVGDAASAFIDGDLSIQDISRIAAEFIN